MSARNKGKGWDERDEGEGAVGSPPFGHPSRRVFEIKANKELILDLNSKKQARTHTEEIKRQTTFDSLALHLQFVLEILQNSTQTILVAFSIDSTTYQCNSKVLYENNWQH